MQIIDADPTRMIELPGIGPCPRPVDIDESVTGFKTLKSLRIYRFSAGQTIEGDSEGDEVYILPTSGSMHMQIKGVHQLTAALSAVTNPALYMTPDHHYRLTAQTDVLVAYVRAAAKGDVACHVLTEGTGNDAEVLRFATVPLADGALVDPRRGNERLIHVISGAVTVGETDVATLQTVALAKGEDATIRANGAAKLLVIHV